MLLLDTRHLPRADRAEAFRVAMPEASVPCRVEHPEPREELRARMHQWSFGRAVLFTTDASGFGLTRTPRHVRMASEPVVGVAFQARGRGKFAPLDQEQLVQGGDLMLVDLTAPSSFGGATGGGSRAFLVAHDQLGLPVDVVRKATPRLRASPLHDLLLRHLQWMCASAPELSTDPGAAALGTATVELVRALIVSAAGGGAPSAAVPEETLASRVRAFVEQHLTEPDLTPEAIAATHSVSVRQLYKACAQAGLSLEQWIIGQRLEAARADLVSATGLRRSISATARACGFASPTHFTRRFRQAYGLTPREWQRMATGG
jgi:AraC-like DNA-binding protein